MVSDALQTITWDLQGISTVEEKSCIVDLCKAMSECYAIDPTRRPTATECQGAVNNSLRMVSMVLYGASALRLTQISSQPARPTVNHGPVHKRDRALFYATLAECISTATS